MFKPIGRDLACLRGLTPRWHDPQNLNPEILATVEHLHSGGFATMRDQAKRVSGVMNCEQADGLDANAGVKPKFHHGKRGPPNVRARQLFRLSVRKIVRNMSRYLGIGFAGRD
jgi:hypothetical protein